MDDLTDTRHINRLEIVDTGRRRRWSAAEKLRIAEESFSGPRLASATARRHGISNQLLFAWRKAYREGQLGDIRGFHTIHAVGNNNATSHDVSEMIWVTPQPPVQEDLITWNASAGTPSMITYQDMGHPIYQ